MKRSLLLLPTLLLISACANPLASPEPPRACTDSSIRDGYTDLRDRLDALSAVTMEDPAELHCDSDDPYPVGYGTATTQPNLQSLGCWADSKERQLSYCKGGAYTWYIRIEGTEVQVALDPTLNRDSLVSLHA